MTGAPAMLDAMDTAVRELRQQRSVEHRVPNTLEQARTAAAELVDAIKAEREAEAALGRELRAAFPVGKAWDRDQRVRAAGDAHRAARDRTDAAIARVAGGAA